VILKSSRSSLFKRYGIILDSLGAKGRIRNQLRRDLMEAYRAEHPGHSLYARDLTDQELYFYLNWVVSTLAAEFGIEVETPGEYGTIGMTLTEYLNYKNDRLN
jgi:hypothetical protein